MTELLLRLFIKQRDPALPGVRAAYGRLASVVGIACNVLLFAGKFLVGTLFGSIAITADAMNNLSDASSNVVSLLGFKLAAKPADADHPYGHGRYEYLAGLCVSVMVLVIGINLLQESFEKVLNPTEVSFNLLTAAVLAASILVKLWLSVFNSKIGGIIDSDTLRATAADSRNDVISTGAVLISTLLCHFTGLAVIDGVMGLAVAAFILYSGSMLVKDTLSPLLGEAPDPELVAYIERRTLSYPGVLGVHDLMVHDYGPGHQFASLHVEFAAESDVLDAHDVIDTIERDFMRNDRLLVTIHYDPIVTADSAVANIRGYLADTLHSIDPTLSLHDLRIVPGATHTNILFDLVLPAGYQGEVTTVTAKLKEAARRKNENYFCVIKIEQSYSGR